MCGGEGCCGHQQAESVAKMVKTIKNTGKGIEGLMGQKNETWNVC